MNDTESTPKPKAKRHKHKRRSSTRAHAVVAAVIPEQPPVPAVMGRPTDYTPELAKAIVEHVSSGESIVSFCDTGGSPHIATVYRWMEKFDDFREAYERARVAQAAIQFEKMQDWAHDGQNDWMEARDKEGAIIGWRINGEAVQRSRLRVETLKWRLSKIDPRYAEMQRREVTGAGGGPIEVMAVEAREKIMGAIFEGLKIEPKADDQDSATETEEILAAPA